MRSGLAVKAQGVVRVADDATVGEAVDARGIRNAFYQAEHAFLEADYMLSALAERIERLEYELGWAQERLAELEKTKIMAGPQGGGA